MTERPILFSGPMVRAILAGTKTQTRRLAASGIWGSAPREFADHADWARAWVDGADNNQYLHVPCHVDSAGACAFCDHRGLPETSHRLWPRYRLGDLLWVRETWRMAQWGSPIYLADKERSLGMDEYSDRHNWKPSIHMPRVASRITLRVTSVRVERLQDISVEDSMAEGIDHRTMNDPRVEFRHLWESINAKRAPWASNPWVWVIAFTRVEV